MAEWAAQERSWSQEPWRGRLSCGLPGGPPWLPVQLGRRRLAARGPRLLGQVESSPFKPARANQGPARPPVQTRAWVQPQQGLRLPPRRHRLRRGGAGEPAASVTAEQHRRLGLPADPPGPEPAAMEHSLHRVSLGSRRAQPGLSFYLSTFGKCPPGRPAAGAAAPGAQRPERALVVKGEAGSRRSFHWGHLLLPLSPCGCLRRGSGAASGRAAAGHHLLPGHGAKCIWFCLTWPE